MIKLAQLEAFEDGRGTIRDLLIEPIDGVTLIHTHARGVRGNHFHKFTTQWTFLVSGRLRVKTQHLFDDPGAEDVLEAGETMVSPPDEAHAWEALEDSVCVVFTSGIRTGTNYEQDTFRLKVPLI